MLQLQNSQALAGADPRAPEVTHVPRAGRAVSGFPREVERSRTLRD